MGRALASRLLVIVTYTPAKGVEASKPGSQWMSEGADVARMSATVEEKVERVFSNFYWR